MSEGSKIDSRRKSGVCAKHQRHLAKAIKRARHLGMLPFDRTHKFVIKQTYQRGPKPSQETAKPAGETKQEPESSVAEETATN